MPRRLRIEMAGGVYHVTNRGVDRTDIVRNDADREQWYRYFTRAAVRCHWRVFAEVLMTNHFHIFLKTPEPNLSEGMHAIESSYATYFNKQHGRHGALFQGRFHAVLVEQESHAWSLSRYVHLNPYRAKLASQPAAYRWSSYHWYLDPQNAPEWLDWRTIFAEFGGTEAAARIAYKRFVEQDMNGPTDDPFKDAYAGVLLGSEPFVERFRHLVDDPNGNPCEPRRRVTLADAIAAVVSAFEVTPESLAVVGRHGNAPRDAAIWLCRELTRHSLDEISAEFGGVTRSAVTDAVRRCDKRQQAIASYRVLCVAARRLAEQGSREEGSGVRISEIAAGGLRNGEIENGDF
ncbi:MAG: helix-turn-helix domain-containing protein [Planctomycetaceae bacterium]